MAISPQAWTPILSPIYSLKRLGGLQYVFVACQPVKWSLYQKEVVSPGPDMTLRTMKQEVVRPSAHSVWEFWPRPAQMKPTPDHCSQERRASDAGRVQIYRKGNFPAFGSRMRFTSQFSAEFWFGLVWDFLLLFSVFGMNFRAHWCTTLESPSLILWK